MVALYLNNIHCSTINYNIVIYLNNSSFYKETCYYFRNQPFSFHLFTNKCNLCKFEPLTLMNILIYRIDWKAQLHEKGMQSHMLSVATCERDAFELIAINYRTIFSYIRGIKTKVQRLPTSVTVNPRRRRPSILRPRSSALSPATIEYLGTSCETFRHKK